MAMSIKIEIALIRTILCEWQKLLMRWASLFSPFFPGRDVPRDKRVASHRARYSLACGLPSYWLNTRCLLLDWDVRRANLRRLFPHTHADGGKTFFSIIDAEKLSRRRSARITKHAHCPCGYVLFFFSYLGALLWGCARMRKRAIQQRSPL